ATYALLPSGVSVTQPAPFPPSSAPPSDFRSGSEYAYRKLFNRLQTTSVLPSAVTAMPCDGSEPAGTVDLPGGRSGFLIRLISLRVAKSTTANPLKPVNCTKSHFVEPSALVENVIGRTPRSMSSVHAGCSVWVSNTFTVLPAIDPATTYLPSGVT